MSSIHGAAEPDRELIRRCRQGSVGAWHQVVNRYERLIYSIPLRYGLSREDAAYIAQLTFTILVQNLDTLHDDSRLGSWLATVARRHTWRLLERNRYEIASEHLENSSLAESVALLGKRDTDSIEHWELTDWLDTALSKISERCRKLLLALYFQPGRSSYAEVAAHLDIPIGSIGPTRACCLQKLRRVIGEG